MLYSIFATTYIHRPLDISVSNLYGLFKLWVVLMSDERKTDPSELRDLTVPPTLPPGMYTIPQEVLQHLFDSQCAIHEEIRQLKLSSAEPPPWAEKLLGEMNKRIEHLEAEVKKMQSTCNTRHSNGTSKNPLNL